MTEPKISFKGPGRCEGCEAPLPKGTDGHLCPACAAKAADGAQPAEDATPPPADDAAETPPAVDADGSPPGELPPQPEDWFDRPENLQKLGNGVIGLCVLLVAAELVGVFHKHAHFGWDGWLGFFAVFGFVSYSLVVVLGVALQRAVSRPEDYYDE